MESRHKNWIKNSVLYVFCTSLVCTLSMESGEFSRPYEGYLTMFEQNLNENNTQTDYISGPNFGLCRTRLFLDWLSGLAIKIEPNHFPMHLIIVLDNFWLLYVKIVWRNFLLTLPPPKKKDDTSADQNVKQKTTAYLRLEKGPNILVIESSLVQNSMGGGVTERIKAELLNTNMNPRVLVC